MTNNAESERCLLKKMFKIFILIQIIFLNSISEEISIDIFFLLFSHLINCQDALTKTATGIFLLTSMWMQTACKKGPTKLVNASTL